MSKRLVKKAEKKYQAKPGTKRCEGWRRYGGAFSLGPVKWEQCSEQAVLMLTVKQDGETSTLPACVRCWEEVRRTKEIKLIAARPIRR